MPKKNFTGQWAKSVKPPAEGRTEYFDSAVLGEGQYLGLRVGQIRMATDTSASTSAIDDNYTETAAVDITFSADISVANTLRLMYTDGANAITKFKYTYQLWNSN